MRSLGTWVVLLGVAACGPEPTEELNTLPLSRPSDPPEVGIDAEDGAIWISPGRLTGFVSDGEQSPSTLPVQLESVVDGVLFSGNAGAGGEWSWQGELTPGDNPVLVTTVDREGNRAEASVVLSVRPNAAPRCRIVQPTDGARVRTRTDVTFESDVSDADGDELIVLWRSSLEGGLGVGWAFTRRFREAGMHIVEIEVRDPFEAVCTDSVQVIVTD